MLADLHPVSVESVPSINKESVEFFLALELAALWKNFMHLSHIS